MKIFQKLNFGKGGCSLEDVRMLGIEDREYWKMEDIVYLEKINLGSLSDIGRKFLLSKRALDLGSEGVVCIPRNEIALSLYLGKLAKLWFNYLETEKKEVYDSFLKKLLVLRIEIAKRIFSKRFSEKYQLKFNGISGVALSHARGIDEIMVPEWSGIPLNSLVMVMRDPIQNIIVSLRVTGYTKNEIRVSPTLIEILAGDFDGDKIQVVHCTSFYEENKQFLCCSLKDFLAECNELVPSHFKYKELLIA